MEVTQSCMQLQAPQSCMQLQAPPSCMQSQAPPSSLPPPLPEGVVDDDNDHECVITSGTPLPKARWVHAMTNMEVNDVVKGDLLIHDVYGPVYFEAMTVWGARVVGVFAIKQEITNTTKQHLRCATAHERELVFAQLSVPLQYGEGDWCAC